LLAGAGGGRRRSAAGRAKLELAHSYLKLGSSEIARRYFQEVLATNPPEAIWQNVQRFLAAIEAAEKRHFINGLFTVGAGYDDNVRTAPPHDFVYIVPLSFDRESYSLLNTNLVLNHVYRPRYSSPWSWKTSLTNYNVFHESVNDIDLNLYGLGTGPSWRRERLLLQGWSISTISTWDMTVTCESWGPVPPPPSVSGAPCTPAGSATEC